MIVINGLNPTRNIEAYVDELADVGLPAAAIAACLIRYDEAGSLLLESLAQAADAERVGSVEVNQFFNVIHIVAGARDKRAFAPLLQVLRLPDEKLDPLLGAAISTLPRIVIGTFDGDCEALFATIRDLRVSVLNRVTLFDAATYLTWEGRIERQRMVSFLQEFELDGGAANEELLWGSWLMSIALLGLSELETAALRVLQKGLASDDVDQEFFAETLASAREMPGDAERFELRDLGHIDDVLEVLQLYVDLDEAYDEMEEDEAEDLELEFQRQMNRQRPAPFELQPPVINPLRGVGRNDPCPCGSGKKAKRCCLAA
jgi:hypothetical protein